MLTDTERSVLSHIDPDEVVRWVQELTRIPSVYHPQTGQAEEPAARWVRDRMEEMGLETHFEVVAPGRPNVIGLYNASDAGPCLMFEGHTDVVTEGDRSAWTCDPFGGVVKGGRIYGRGANDMKGGLVAALAAVKAIVHSRVSLHGSILIGALVDEEGGMLGVKHFVENGWAERVRAAIICEPEDNRICIAQKGVMWARVTITGEMAHGAMPLTGVNPIIPMAHFLTAVEALEKEEIARYGTHPYLGQPSLTPTILQSPPLGHGEPQNNVMPAQCQAMLDLRLLPEQSPEEVVARLRGLLGEAIAAYPGARADLTVLEVRPSTATSPEEPIVRVMAQAYADLTGEEPQYAGVPGSTDGTILQARCGIPIVTCGPGDSLIPHHVDEYLDIDQLITATRLYALTALRYLEVGMANSELRIQNCEFGIAEANRNSQHSLSRR